VPTPSAERKATPWRRKTFRRRNEDGDSTKARGCSPRRSVTNHQDHASRPGNRAQAGNHPPIAASQVLGHRRERSVHPVVPGAPWNARPHPRRRRDARVAHHTAVVIEHLNEDIPPEPAQPLTVGQHDDSAARRLVSRLKRPRLHTCNAGVIGHQTRPARPDRPPTHHRVTRLRATRPKKTPAPQGFTRVSIPNRSPRLQGGCSAC
jgi:hypothetical protein